MHYHEKHKNVNDCVDDKCDCNSCYNEVNNGSISNLDGNDSDNASDSNNGNDDSDGYHGDSDDNSEAFSLGNW